MPESFGAQLRACRIAAGLSMGELARRVNYHKSYLSKLENDHKSPSLTMAKLCDAALETGGVLAGLVAEDQPARTQDPAGEGETAGETWLLGLTASGGLRFDQGDRFPASGPAIFTAITGAGQVADEQVIAALRVSFDQYRALGMAVSPALVLGPVIAHLQTLRALAAEATGSARIELLLLASRAAEYAGWMSQEAGDDRAASWWTAQAVRLGTESLDPQIAGYALVRRAEVALYRHDAISTIELAGRAQLDTRISPRVRGLAARCEAQGHALAGDAAACRRALDRAAELFAAAAAEPPSSAPMLGSSSGADELRLALGWSLFDLGLPAEAAAILEQHLASIPPASRRARARFGIRQALAYGQAGEVDQACLVVRATLDDAIRVDSATIRADLRNLVRVLNRWSTHDAVRQTQPLLLRALSSQAGE
ncbi:helix-turn-helix transcriptional regulator [Streptomyces sp. SID13031]|uniref:helix-turn-helix domain-containing protein n=1 Tax=Streptomyces sp. SID13031 TaxID=2706046 RepID=UPI0013CBE466|nr:helix-turn-helix transcriptional regulator [Streptomyces sp. SID13031]